MSLPPPIRAPFLAGTPASGVRPLVRIASDGFSRSRVLAKSKRLSWSSRAATFPLRLSIHDEAKCCQSEQRESLRRRSNSEMLKLTANGAKAGVVDPDIA